MPNFIRKKLRNIGLFASLLAQTIFCLFNTTPNQRKIFWRTFHRQVYYTGVQALIPILFISMAFGGIALIQIYNQVPTAGINLISGFLAIIVLRELAPLIISFILIGRSVTATTTRIGNMRASGQYTMLLTMGVNPNLYLFAPRVWSMVVSMQALLIFFSIFMLIGSFTGATLMTHVNYGHLLRGVLEKVQISDMILLFIKGCFLAFTISIISIARALTVERSTREVSQATTAAVVQAIFYVFIIDVIFAVVFHL